MPSVSRVRLEDTLASTTAPAAIRWSGIIDRHEASGLSIREFSEEIGVNPKTLSWWRCELGRTRARNSEASPFVELLVSESEAEKPAQPVAIMLHAFDARLVVDHRTDLVVVRRLLELLS